MHIWIISNEFQIFSHIFILKSLKKICYAVKFGYHENISEQPYLFIMAALIITVKNEIPIWVQKLQLYILATTDKCNRNHNRISLMNEH